MTPSDPIPDPPSAVGLRESPCAVDPEAGEAHGPRGLIDRELSWLDFNARVLQEAADPEVPLFERLKFMGIFASNLDEFFRVRVASLRSLLRLKKKRVRRLSLDPRELLEAIHDVVSAHQEWFDRLFREELLPALAERGVVLVDERGMGVDLRERVGRYFEERVADLVDTFPAGPGRSAPLLDNDSVYLAVELLPGTPPMPGREAPDVVLVRVPSPPLPRFVEFPGDDGRTRIVFLDDVIRAHLTALFSGRRVVGAWGVGVSRDAELYLEREFEGDVVDAVRRSLKKRKTGSLTRFLYDPDTPPGVMARLEELLELEPEDLFENGRYPRMGDLVAFPRRGTGGSYPDWRPAPHPALVDAPSVAEVVERGDRLLHFPYQPYDHVVRFLTEAAGDPAVERLRLTIYRVSRGSAVLRALVEAAERGKDVRVFVEAKARFDEESNLRWARRLEAAGILTYYSFPHLKVHAKVALVTRRAGGRPSHQAYLGTGNFNEETARYYADLGLLTADPALTGEVEKVFHFLEGRLETPRFEHLMVAPFDLRKRVLGLIRGETERAARGENASVVLKLNGLEDEEVIESLCEAARVGVVVRGIVRGICRLVPDESVWGETLQLRSIVDRYLEHGRAYVFGNGGDPLVYLASADWMYRNLNRRVEIGFPVRDPACRDQVLHVLRTQLADNRKARVLAAGSHNRYARDGGPPLRSQEAIYRWLASRSPGAGR